MTLIVLNRTFATPLGVISAPTERPTKPHLEDLGRDTYSVGQPRPFRYHRQVDLDGGLVTKIHDEHSFS